MAGACYLTRTRPAKRFHKHSGDEYQNAEYKVQKDDKEVGGADDRERAAFWEIWDKGSQSASSGSPRAARKSSTRTNRTSA